MFLNELSIIGFKNLMEETIEFSSRVNCFVGDNGAGKTNILDAIHYLSMGRSVLSMTDSQSVRHGDDFFVLDGTYQSSKEKKEQVLCTYKRGSGKTLKRNGKEYTKLSDHIGMIPIVTVSPADSFLITEAAEERRRYLNSFLSQLDKSYLNAIMRYNQVLSERNKLLKEDSLYSMMDLLDVLDMQLVEHGELVHKKHAELVEQLAPLVEEHYKELSDDKEQIELTYRSALNDAPFAELLKEAKEKDKAMQFTTVGVHRDDMVMTIGGHPLRRYGSQGQQKSFLVALKLAQYNVVANIANEKPILLLDDLFDRLDLQRVEKLLGIVERTEYGQIFITDCNSIRLKGVLDKSSEDYSLFKVDEGEVDKI